MGLPDETDQSMLTWAFDQLQMTTMPLNEAMQTCKTKFTDRYRDLISPPSNPTTISNNPTSAPTPAEADPWAAARGDGTASGWGADAGWGAAAAPADDGWGASAGVGVSADWGAPPTAVDNSWSAPTQLPAASSDWGTDMSSPSKLSNGPSGSTGDPSAPKLVLGGFSPSKIRLLEERVGKDLIAEFTKMQFHPALIQQRRFVMLTDVKARHFGESVRTFPNQREVTTSDVTLLRRLSSQRRTTSCFTRPV